MCGASSSSQPFIPTTGDLLSPLSQLQAQNHSFSKPTRSHHPLTIPSPSPHQISFFSAISQRKSKSSSSATNASHLNSSNLASFANPPANVSSYTSTLFRIMIYLQDHYLAQYTNRIVMFFNIAKLPFGTRYNMVSTGPLSKQVALEEWREDIARRVMGRGMSM